MARQLILSQVLRPFVYLKKYMPKTMLGRSLAILITPMILVQLITGYVFWDRHWSKFTGRVAHQISQNVAAVLEMSSSAPMSEMHIEQLNDFAQRHFDMTVSYEKPGTPFVKKTLRALKWREHIVENALSHAISYPFNVRVVKEDVRIHVSTMRGIYHFSFTKRILFPRSTPIVIWWEVGAPIFFLLIAISFMRNQIRPMQTLAHAVDEFGKGRDVGGIKPSGALEVRRVARAFNAMRDRILKQITQRTEMLAGISHDLKTPLTRMELQLALMKQSEDIQNLRSDVKEMERMVEEYLAFARGEEGESSKSINIRTTIQNLVDAKESQRVHIDALENVFLEAKPIALKRALRNIVGNALRYGTNVWISSHLTAKNLRLTFDDDGPGIPEDRREDVFRPFVRLDASRNTQTGGYGLGLSITRDIIVNHGGTIKLTESPQSGLRVTLTLPR